MIRFLPLLLLLIAAPVSAAERAVFVSSFERLRVEGPFQVAVTTGRSPRASVAGDARALERVEVRLDGSTLVVRPTAERWQEQRSGAPSGIVTITLQTPMLASVSVIGGATVAVTGGKAARLDLSVTGAGAIALTGAQTEQANATVIGQGRIALAGRTGKARLLVNGGGRIEADALDAGELTVRVDGPGEALGRARFQANVVNTGLGHVAVAGTPKCVVRSDAGGPVTCGVGR